MNVILDLLITAAAVLAFAGTIVSAINELLLGIWGARGRYLRLVLHRMLDADHDNLSVGMFRENGFLSGPRYNTIADELLQDPRVSAASKNPNTTLGVGKPSRQLPGFIAKEAFGEALLDVLRKRGTAITFQPNGSLAVAFPEKGAPDPRVQTLLTHLLSRAKSLDDAVKELGNWFVTTMARASWRYRQGLRSFSILMALILSIAVNFRPVGLMVALANQMDEEAIVDFSAALGWFGPLQPSWPLEWLLGALLIGLGGPFWFDLATRVGGLKEKPNKN